MESLLYISLPAAIMWISHHKRIQLWHTARNILAIFYMCQISLVHCCQTKFDDVQSKAVLSQIVIVGRIRSLEVHSGSSTGRVQVLSVLKQTDGGGAIQRKQNIEILGLVSLTSAGLAQNSTLSPIQHLNSSWPAPTPQANGSCSTFVNLTQQYILFMNRRGSAYHTAQLASHYTRADKKLVKDVACQNCAQKPNAKAKRNVHETEGATNYKITCRVEGNPPPEVTWYRNDVELTDTLRGIAIKHRRRKSVHQSSIRFKKVKLEHSATYRCVATNVLGTDTAKSRFTVIADVQEATPTPPIGDIDWESVNVDDLETIQPASHYIPCTGKDKDFCLHGGECKIYPDGRYKHCRCVARFTGTRCEEANIVPPTIHPTKRTLPYQLPKSMELTSVVVALAVVLAVLAIFLVTMAFYFAGWKYSSQKNRRMRARQLQMESRGLLRGIESDMRTQIVERETKGTQTEPVERCPQQIRKSLNLENFYPHSSSDVMLRRKSLGAATGRPASQPVDRRLTRSRLSGTSTITESKVVSEFDVLAERTPSPSIDLDIARSTSSCRDNSQFSCDVSAGSNSLHISEPTIDNETEALAAPAMAKATDDLSIDNNANARLGSPFCNGEL